MAKRFIDTELFKDDTFSNYSIEGKLFFIYFITNCNHAGVLKINKKLIEFQTGINSYLTVREELANSLVTLSEEYIWMPKFLKFQYPDFPKSSVRQQVSALKILNTFGIDLDKLKTYLTLSKELPNSYDNDNVYILDNKKGKIENLNYSIQKNTIEKYENELLESKIWQEHCRRLFKIGEVELLKEISKFIDLQKATSINYIDENDAKKHFVNWFKKNGKISDLKNFKISDLG